MSETETVPLGSIVSLVTEKVTVGKDPSKAYVGLEHIPSGGSSLVGFGSAGDSISTNNVFRARDTLFGKLRPRLRKSVRVNFDGYCSTDILVLRANEAANADFASFVLRSERVFAEAIRTEEGTKMPRCSWQSLRKVSVFCPRPPVRRRIAEILSTVDEVMEQTEALIAKYQQIKAGLMQDLFTRGVTPDGQLRPTRAEAPQLYKKEPRFGWIPKEWECLTVDQLLASPFSSMRSGPFGSALLKNELVEDGIPLLGIDNIFIERFEPVFRRFVSRHKFNELIRYSVFPGDVIITIMGTVGRSCVVPNSVSEALSSKHIWTMTFDTKKVFPELICWQLNYASWVKKWFARQSQGAVMEAIQASTLRTLKLPVPKIDEQKLTVERYQSITKTIQGEREYLAKLRARKQGLMQDLLTGRIPLPENRRA